MENGEDEEYARFVLELSSEEGVEKDQDAEIRRLNAFLELTGDCLRNLGFQDTLNKIKNGSYASDRIDNDHYSKTVRWLVGRLCVLQRLDWLQTVSCLLLKGEQTERFEKDRMRVYRAFMNRSCLDIARECALSGNVKALEALLKAYPYSLMPSIMEILSSMLEVVDIESLTEFMVTIIDMRQYDEYGGPPLRRDADWVETKESTLLLNDSAAQFHDSSWKVRTELTAKLHYGWRCLSNKQLESWILHRSLEVERITGLYRDSLQLLQAGVHMLAKCGHESSLLKTRIYLCQEYEICLRLKDILRSHHVENVGKEFPKSLMHYISADIEARISMFLSLVLSYEDNNDLDTIRIAYMSRYFDIQKTLDPDFQNILHLVLVEIAYSHKQWILEFIKLESLSPIIFSGRASICSLCLDIVINGPGDSIQPLNLHERHSFQTILLNIAEELMVGVDNIELQERLKTMQRASRAAALLQEIGKDVDIHETFKLLSQDAFNMLIQVIEDKYGARASRKDWNKVQDTFDLLVQELGISDGPREELQEFICQSSLRLGHIGPTEKYLGTIDSQKKEDILTSLAHNIICVDEGQHSDSIDTAKRLLNLIPDKSKAEKEILLLDTVVKLQELGIYVSARELKQSSNVSQLFQSAIQNIKSTSALHDIDKIIEMTCSLDLPLTNNEILVKLAETAFGLEDAALCEKLCLKIVQDGSLKAVPIVSNVAQSNLNIRPESRQILLSFSLHGARETEILKVLPRNNPSLDDEVHCPNVLDQVLGGSLLFEDERALIIQIATSLLSKDLEYIATWLNKFLSASEDVFQRNLSRSIHVGVMCGICLKVLSLCIHKGKQEDTKLDEEQLLQLPISDICFWGSKMLESPVESIDPDIQAYLITTLQRIGTSILSIADENRLSMMNDKSAERLWASGDIKAQKNILWQLTDKIAASQVSHFGVIDCVESFYYDDINVEGMRAPELSSIGILAHRCGTEFQEIEEMFVGNVLRRRGCTQAFGNSWAHISGKNPLNALKIVLEFVITSVEVGNYEVLRAIQMVERCISLGACGDNHSTIISPSLYTIHQSCIWFMENSNLDLRPFCEPFFLRINLMVHGSVHTMEPSFCLTSWFISVSHPNNANMLYDFMIRIRDIYDTINEQSSDKDAMEYPVDPNVVILSALSEMLHNHCSVPSVSKLVHCVGAELLLSLGLSLSNDDYADVYLHIPREIKDEMNTVPDSNLLYLYHSIIDLTHNSELSIKYANARASIIRKRAELICSLESSDFSLSDSLVMGICELSLQLTESSSNIGDLIAPLLSDCIYTGMQCDVILSKVMDIIVQITLDGERINKLDILHRLYICCLDTCTQALRDFGEDSMTTGEAIQNIFGIVRSLDCSQCEGLDLIRTDVYDRIKEYISTPASGVDALHSEIQIQLIEMMMTIGKDKWLDWQPEDANVWSLKPESLLHSRLVSHFSVSWENVMREQELQETSWASCEEANKAMCDMSRKVTSPEQAFALWSAVTSIILPHYANEEDAAIKLQGSFISAMECVLNNGNIDDTLTMLDEFSAVHGHMPEHLQGQIIESASCHGDYKYLVAIMINQNDILEGTAVSLFNLIKSTDVPDKHKVAAVLGLVECKLLSHLIDEAGANALKLLNSTLHNGSILLKKVRIVSRNTEKFDCPLRVPIYSYMISQLVLAGKNVAASYLAFETLGLENNLRVKDSGMPIILGFLSSFQDVHWVENQADLVSLGVPATATLGRMLRDFSQDSCRALEICMNM